MANIFNPQPDKQDFPPLPSEEELEEIRKQQEEEDRRLEMKLQMLRPLSETGVNINADPVTPGVLPSFVKGLAESVGVESLLSDYTDEWGTSGFQPTSWTETGSELAGIFAGTLAQMATLKRPSTAAVGALRGFRLGAGGMGPPVLANRALMKTAFGQIDLTAIGVEALRGGIPDALYTMGQLMDKEGIAPEEAGVILTANVIGSMLFPGKLDDYFFTALAKEGGEKSGKEILEDVAQRTFGKLEQEELTPYKPPDTIFNTKESKAVYKKQPTAFAGAIDVVNKNIDEYVTQYNGMVSGVKRKAYQPVNKWRINPGKADNESLKFVDTQLTHLNDNLGGLLPIEIDDVIRKVDDSPLRAVSKDYLKSNLRLRVAGADGIKFGMSGSRAELYTKTLDDWMDNLIWGDAKLMYHLNPEMPTPAFMKFVERMESLSAAGTKQISEGMGGVKKDIRTALNMFQDPNVPKQVPPGFARSDSSKQFFANLDVLPRIIDEDTSILKKEFDRLGEQFKKSELDRVAQYRRGVSMVMQEQPVEAMERFEAIINSLESAELKNLYFGTDLKKINTAVGEALQRKLKEQFHLIDEQLGAQVDELEQRLPFMPAEEAGAIINELDNISRQLVSRVMQKPQLARQIADTTTDPHLKNLIDTWHAVMGDPTAEAIVRTQLKNPAPGIAHSIDRKLAEQEVTRAISGGAEGLDHTFDEIVENASKNQNFFTRFFESPITHIEALARAEKNPKTQALLEEGTWLYREFAQGYRDYLGGTLKENQEVDAVLDAWASLGKDGRAIVRKVTDELSSQANEMRRAGKSDDDIYKMGEAYLAKQSKDIQDKYKIYQAFDQRQYDLMNEAIDTQNREFGTNISHIPYRPYHVHFRYEGLWVGRWETPDGKPITLVFDDNEDLARGLNELMERGTPIDDLRNFKLEPKWYDAMGDFDIADSILKDAEAFQVDTKELRKAFDITPSGFNKDTVGDVVFGAMKPRTMGVETLRSQTEIVMAIQARLNQRYYHMTVPAIKMKQWIKKLESVGLHSVAEDARSYTNDVLGRTGDLEGKVDRFMTKFVDHLFEFEPSRVALEGIGIHRNGRVVRSFASMMTFMGRMMTIGFNPLTAMIQWLILPTNVGVILKTKNVLQGLRHIPKFTEKGSRWHKLAARGGIFLKEGQGTWSDFFRRSGKGGSGMGMQVRLTKPRNLMSRAEKFQDAADYYSMWMFNESENMIRSASLYAGVLDAQQRSARLVKMGKEFVPTAQQDKRLLKIAKRLVKPITDDAVHDQYALDMMLDLNFDFDISGLSRFGRNPFTKVAAQFKTYFSQELEFLTGRKMELTPMERFQSLGMFATFGGLMALPFAEDINTIATWVYGENPKKWMHENLPDVVLGGLPAVGGVSMTGPIAMGGAQTFSVLTEGFGQGVATSKLHQIYSRVRSRKYTLSEALLRSNATLSRVYDATQLWDKNYVDRPGGVVERGGKAAAVAKAVGWETYANRQRRDLHYIKRATQDVRQRELNSIRNKILKSANPSKEARKYIKQGKITPSLVKRWFTEQEQRLSEE